MFLEKFVEKYRHKLPEVVEAYQGKLRFQGFSFELKCDWLLYGQMILVEPSDFEFKFSLLQ